MRDRASAIVFAAACCIIQGSALADSIAEKAMGDVLSTPAPVADDGAIKPVVAPVALPTAMTTTATAMPAVTPAGIIAPAAPELPMGQAGVETGDRRDRTRIISYILLQGLQGAGPFAGAR